MTFIRRVAFFLFLLLPAWSGPAQTSANLNRNLNRMSVEGMDDMAKVKLLADRGNVNAQLKVANACMENRLYADALKWYSLAADQGMQEARYQKGHILLFGCQGTGLDQKVAPNPAEGLKFTFLAATNRHSGACLDMGRALKDGIGCRPDPVIAYAWYSLCADAGDTPSHAAMNELALRISTEDIRLALARARDMKAGHWPDLTTTPVAYHAPVQVAIKLKLSGVVVSPRGNLAVINNHTLGEGESVQLATEQKELVAVTCQHIERDSVEVLVDGEAQPRTLVTEPR